MQVFHHNLLNVREGEHADVSIYLESPYFQNPSPIIDKVIAESFGNDTRNEYIEEWLDNPWLRVVIRGIENLNYEFHNNGIASFSEFLLGNGNSKMVVLFANPAIANPKALLDEAVVDFVHGLPYNAFVEKTLDNPWVRVVVVGLNNIFVG